MGLAIVGILWYTNFVANQDQQRLLAICEDQPSHPYCLDQ